MNNKLAGLLSYAFGWIGGVVFLFLAPYNQDQEVRFHAWQSILFFVATSIAYFAISMLGAFIPFLWILTMAMGLGMLAMWVFLMVRAYQGNAFRIPVVAEYADKFSRKS